ncbi:MAG: UbiA family prenyltransferase [Pseudomonadota bacterium]
MTAKDRRDSTPVLVVDLDGTLIRSDALYECFWRALSRTWRTLPNTVSWLTGGRAVLKQKLAELANLNPEFLPYNKDVLNYIQDWRANGGRAVLVTASDQSIADGVAEYTQLFDDAVGSDGSTNLKGEAKARLLQERFNDVGYVYMGDSSADLPVWEGATKAIAVNPSSSIEKQVQDMPVESEILHSDREPRAYLKALRPHQWLKNILLFLPMMGAHSFDLATLMNAIVAFCAFSLVSSSGYVFNDLMDLRADRAHPRKSARPFASGQIPIMHGTAMVPILLLGGLALGALVNWQTFGVIAVYFVMTTVYSLHIKSLAIADICMLGILYTLRIIAGGLATGLTLSVWLLAFSMFFFFALAAVKRQAELVDLRRRGIPNARRRGYAVDDLPIIRQLSVASGFVSVLVLALYLDTDSVKDLYSTPRVLGIICLILLYWISRISLKAHRGEMHDDPIVYALRDKVSLACIVIIIIAAFGASAL